ncbi:hypothetical protein M9H77_17268 [Catharanthus roseus]|uniref:Uncharacterized protein n=1 Tax=Catharanthus roseus TaxID=4058 RepID=A0ACC0B429_CATRO|nr:hypothetical protein M9H77_17268 [Catharanthus roseus]
MEVKLGPITIAQRRKFKALKDNDMIAFMEEALKSKLEGFEGQERASKLFLKCSIGMDQTREQIEGENGYIILKGIAIPPTIALPLPSPAGFWTGSFEESTLPRILEFLFFDSIDLRSSSFCSWGFKALVSSRFFL